MCVSVLKIIALIRIKYLLTTIKQVIWHPYEMRLIISHIYHLFIFENCLLKLHTHTREENVINTDCRFSPD